MSITILLADDHPILREGLRNIIEKQGFKVIAEAENGLRAVALAEEHQPDLVIMDVSMPGMNGIDATRKILVGSPKMKIIGLSMHSDKQFVLSMIDAGAVGYLRKNCSSTELVEAIRTVLHEQIYISPKIGTIKAQDLLQREETKEIGSDNLLGREREILQRIAEGQSTKEIAEGLFISVKTVEKARQAIMDKLEIHTIAGLTKYALRNGLTSLEN